MRETEHFGSAGG